MRNLKPLFAIVCFLPFFCSVFAQQGDSETSVKWDTIKKDAFALEFTTQDRALAPILLEYIARGKQTVEQFFGETYPKEFVVRIFPNRKSLTAHWSKAWNIPDLQTACWMVASGTAKEMAMLSPAAWKTEACEHDFADSSKTQKLITHELTHVFHGQHSPRPDFNGLDDIGWFLEGVAVYVSGQLEEGHLATPKEAIETGNAPTELENAWSGRYRYGVSGSLVEYIDKTYGREIVEKMLKGVSEEELLAHLGISEEKLLQRWRDFVLSGKLLDSGIEDFLLDKLSQHRVLVIPECLSHDSYDAVRLPLNMIKRWSENDHGINKIIVGLETETDSKDFDLIRANKFHQSKRYATICPPGWGLHSTKKLDEYLFYKEITEKLPTRFEIFGFENSYHYYDKARGKYVLPAEIDSVAQLERIPNLESEAPMIVKYIYSKFFRDYRSFSTIREKIQANPEAHFLIITGNAHTLKKMDFNETDEQIIQAYKIDTLKYSHRVGYFLKEHYSPLFIQSNTNTAIDASSLFEYDPAPANPDTVRFKRFKYFFTDYIYSIPETEKTNVEKPPLLCIPSATNLTLLENKNFDLYQSEEFVAIAQKLIYFMTGVTPKIALENPGQALPCTFLDPKTNAPMDFGKYKTAITRWYADGTYIKRLREDLAAYNHRSLFKGIFRMMGKTDFSALSDSEAQTFIDYLLAALSVIGTEEEQAVAREHLSRKWGAVEDHYGYFKKCYFGQYASRKQE